MNDSFSRNVSSSKYVNTPVRPSPGTSTIMMMMKGNGEKTEVLGTTQIQISKTEQRPNIISSVIRPKSSGSSSSPSTIPFDEHQQNKNNKLNFVPNRFRGSRFIAKSTEQLNRSYGNDHLLNYSIQSNVPAFQSSTKTNVPTSILRQNHLQRHTSSTRLQSSSKKMHALEMACMLFYMFG